jgi:protein-S-isoprenylcysteine O-methyltransferase Ste14
MNNPRSEAAIGRRIGLKSAAGALTGMAGVSAALLAVALMRDWPLPLHLKTLAAITAAGMAMAVVDLQLYRVNLNPTTGLAVAPIRPFNLARTVQKLIGFWLTLGPIAALYWLLPVYSEPFYEPFVQACFYCLPALLILAPLYIGYVDRLQIEPHDAYLDVALLCSGKRPTNWTALTAHARGWAVKAFFLPLMFVFGNDSLAKILADTSPLDSFQQLCSFGIDLLYLIDVLLAVVAYTLTLRLFDSHIRSAEPTVAGWVVCLICYPPFWGAIGAKYLAYDQDGLYWGDFFGGYPILYVLWGSAILALVTVYVWATMVFGLRFSNLTNRGIITSGPYRWVKHPAYLCKNASYWLISVPFLNNSDWSVAVKSCLLLAGLNAVYWLRAVTEERHLAADPAYREYQAFIANDGLWARLRRSW